MHQYNMIVPAIGPDVLENISMNIQHMKFLKNNTYEFHLSWFIAMSASSTSSIQSRNSVLVFLCNTVQQSVKQQLRNLFVLQACNSKTNFLGEP
ncbi:5830_t:CDS:2 [Funneliformis mosseae]|uniref:5830_t:CDS:1 n=1 Tax=Funneliformis mosseae TaxID=27381 RepID=A0A9N8ZDN8_FUNMO|nr:5830_t:CDS:2 [Funneliformis mosseae]